MPARAKELQRTKFVPPADKTRLMMLLQAFQTLTASNLDSKLFEEDTKALSLAIRTLAIGEDSGN